MRSERNAQAPEPATTWSRLPLPRPTPEFRRRAWLSFQRAINPLAPPKPLRPHRER